MRLKYWHKTIKQIKINILDKIKFMVNSQYKFSHVIMLLQLY